jgi:hypothetical protein
MEEIKEMYSDVYISEKEFFELQNEVTSRINNGEDPVNAINLSLSRYPDLPTKEKVRISSQLRKNFGLPHKPLVDVDEVQKKESWTAKKMNDFTPSDKNDVEQTIKELANSDF